MILPSTQELTTQRAADLLGVSRHSILQGRDPPSHHAERRPGIPAPKRCPPQADARRSPETRLKIAPMTQFRRLRHQGSVNVDFPVVWDTLLWVPAMLC